MSAPYFGAVVAFFIVAIVFVTSLFMDDDS